MLIETCAPALDGCKISAARPAQPLSCDKPCGTAVCHCSIWSLWEKSAFGTGSAALLPFSHALNCVLVIGETSVPTLVTNASRLPANGASPRAIFCMLTHEGWRPNALAGESSGRRLTDGI